MKRFRALLVAIILVVGILIPTTTLANSGITVSISDVSLATGATGSVALTITGVTADRPISCITVDVNYDPSVVEVVNASNSDFAGFVSNIQNSDGYTRLVAYVTSPTGLTGTIKVADISLKRLGGESALTLDVITLKDNDGNSISFTVVNGRVAAPSSTPSPPPSTPSPPLTIETNLLGTEASYNISSTGIIQETIEATSADGKLTITVPKDTKALDKGGNPLSTLTSVVNPSPPPPPTDARIIGLAYNFGPNGATFVPPLKLEYTYDPAALPAGVAEADLVLAYYDEVAGKWVELDCVVDTVNNIITASVPHFTTFAIIGTVRPPEEEEIAPPEEEEVAPPEEEIAPPEEEEEVAPPEEEIAPPEEEVAPPEEEVAPPAKPFNWPLVGGIIGGVIVVALLIFFLVVRRRAY